MLFSRRVLQRSIPLIIAIITLVSISSVSAGGKTLYWRRYDVDIQVLENGDLLVEENQEIVFTSGTFTYGYRTIPFEKSEGIDNIEVCESTICYDESKSEQPRTFTTTRNKDEIKVYWFFLPTTNASRTFTFRYRAINAVERHASEGDSVFWKAVPADHAFPISESRVSVTFPQNSVLGVHDAFGVAFETAVTDTKIVFEAKETIPPGQEFEVGVAIAPGTIVGAMPDWQQRDQRASFWDLALWIFGLFLLGVGVTGAIVLWFLRGRDPHVVTVPDIITSPPSDLPPGVAGTLIDEDADIQDVVATVIDLARRGYLVMEERQEDLIFGLLKGDIEHWYQRTDKDTSSLLPHEKSVINHLFASGSKVKLKDLSEKFYKALPGIRIHLYQSTVDYNLFPKSPAKVRGRYVALGISIIVASVLVFLLIREIVGDNFRFAMMVPFIASGISGIVVLAIAQFMPARTSTGAQETEKWRAFRRYLKEIDRHTDLDQASELFDKYLPYAIAFGIDKSWIRTFESQPSTMIPTWYLPLPRSGGHHVPGSSVFPTSSRIPGLGDSGRSITGSGSRPSLDTMSRGLSSSLSSVSSSLTQMLNDAGSTFTSTPRSSGSGGFSGGFSGGGFSGGFGGGGGSAGFG